jgi:hydroxyacylglutathione hydrolase
MWVDVFSDNAFDENCWVIAAEGGEDAVVVDPGFAPERVRGMLERAGKRAVAVLATHGHHDHVGAAADLCGDDLPFVIHEADALALTDPTAWGAGYDVGPQDVKDLRTVADGDVLRFAGFTIHVLHTPGHTPGSVLYRTDGWVLSGDVVFAGAIGRSDFPNSSAEAMERSLDRFLGLPDDLDVFPGHGPRTSVGRERATNPYLRGR